MNEYQDSKFQYGANPNNVQGTEVLEFPVYGLFFSNINSDPYQYVYHNVQATEDYAVYAMSDNDGTRTRVLTNADSMDAESIMSELYYRNKAMHAYADYDINKIRYTVNNRTGDPSYIQPGVSGDYTTASLDPS